MRNGNERYVETIGYLGQIYDFLNEKIFNSELSKPVITVQRDERNKSFGWWTVKKVWRWTDKVPANCATRKDNECPVTVQRLWIVCNLLIKKNTS